MIKRAVGYCRVSSDTQIDNTSIGEQIDKIQLYCKLHNIELIEIFKDEGETGSKTDKRVGYNDMINYASDNDIDAIITNKIDRIHRSGKNLLIMVEDILDSMNVAFVSISEQFDTSTPMGKLFLTMLGGFAEFERSTINVRTKSGRIATAKSGNYAGGNIAYGYKLLDADTFTLEVIPSEAKVVKDIFNYRLDKMSLQRIADTLNDSGIFNRKGNQWTKQTIDYILKNKTYIGEYSYDGKKESNDIKIKVQRIISKQLWNKIQIG